VEKSDFKDAVKSVQDKAEDAKAEVKKVKKDVKEKKTFSEVINEITPCELNDGKTACKSSYGCTFIAEKPEVAPKAYKYTCYVAQKTACSKDGAKKTPTDTEKTEEEKNCKGTQDTVKKCEDLSTNCKALKTEGNDKIAKVEASCVKTPCASYSAFSGACAILGCDYAPAKKASGTATFKCEADSVLTDTAKKDACTKATSSCGIADNGGAECCKTVQTNKDYKAPVSAKCTEKGATTKKPSATTTDKLSATTSNMLTSVTALIVAVFMMS
jgi:phage host-nuclease inhibitor protein Gam